MYVIYEIFISKSSKDCARSTKKTFFVLKLVQKIQ